MKQHFENIVFEYLKRTLPVKLQSMLVKGHSNDTRPIPYICVDCIDPKPFGGLDPKHGLFELTLNISVADSAHDINYEIQSERRRVVETALFDFEYIGDDLKINYFGVEEDSDARDDNNIGDVLKYSAIIQTL